MERNKGSQKHIPVRMCIATGVKKPKNELIRLVRMGDGSVKVDTLGKIRGRGANLDMSIVAFDLAVKKRAIERALKLESLLSESEIERLRKEFITAIEEKKFRPFNKPVVIRVKKEEILNTKSS